MTVRNWYEFCACPGAELGRERAGQPPDLEDLVRQSGDDARLRHEASVATRAIAIGKTREEIRAILVAENRARGLQPLPPPFMDLELDSIMTGGNVLGRLRQAGREMGMRMGIGRKMPRDRHQPLQGSGTDLILDREPIIVYADRSLPVIEAELDASAREWLGSGELGDTEERGFFALLKAETSPAGAGQVAIYAGDRRIGVLRGSDSAAYSTSLEAGTQANRPVVTEVILRRGQDGSWRLNLYQPET